jgi:hypothetical protein
MRHAGQENPAEHAERSAVESDSTVLSACIPNADEAGSNGSRRGDASRTGSKTGSQGNRLKAKVGLQEAARAGLHNADLARL